MLWHTVIMKTQPSAILSKGYRFPSAIISHCVRLYFRFSLSFRDIEELMTERGVVLTYETVRQWCLKFEQTYANELKRRRPQTGDRWHLDEVFLKINGKTRYLWRAVDQHGNTLDILVQSRRNKRAAKKFFRKLLKGLQYGIVNLFLFLGELSPPGRFLDVFLSILHENSPQKPPFSPTFQIK